MGLETIFFRISQLFENNLLLLKLPKFRHFKRYYFALNYDWDKLEFVQKKYDQLKIRIYEELNLFIEYLNKLNP